MKSAGQARRWSLDIGVCRVSTPSPAIAFRRALRRPRQTLVVDPAVSEGARGPANDRRYSYEPTFLLRGLTELHIEFTPVDVPATLSTH